MSTQVLRADLYGASIARLDNGQVYCSLFVGQPVVDEQEENAKGIVLMKVSCDEDVYTSLKAPAYPCPVDLRVRLRKAAGGKMGQHCTGLELARPERKAG